MIIEKYLLYGKKKEKERFMRLGREGEGEGRRGNDSQVCLDGAASPKGDGRSLFRGILDLGMW